ncbi:4Fe-4S cluster-binding domain-containing protein, partial [Synergistaceae bacterium OttesenSCG-928-I11]|nr:4Fe-4S cluster-binding domain-containing protein [Synergistaceae bacterium OttesenSCG-928-I11]
MNIASQERKTINEVAKGQILRIEKSSIHDGEGLRSVVFFKGCPMRCAWCSTP